MNILPFRAPWLVSVARVFASAGKPLYAVGGIVRNAIMNLPASDIDLCGPARPEQVAALCEGTPIRAVLRAAHFGTVELHVADAEGRHMAEYTTFRVDSYRCGHQPSSVHFADTVETDALRRDFSVNALYLPLLPDSGPASPIQDPTGGLMHLRQHALHTVTADPDLVFKDDGLRILRAARFQAELALTPTPAVLASAARYAPLLAEIARERLRAELEKLLLSDTRYPTLARTEPPVVAGLVTVRQVGAWRNLFGDLQPEETLLAALADYIPPAGLPPVSGKLSLLFAKETPEALAAQMRALRFSVRETVAAATALTALRGMIAGTLSRIEAFRLGAPAITHTALALQAMAQAGAPHTSALAQAQAFSAALADASLPRNLKELALRGDALLPLCQRLSLPQSRIGQALDALWQAVVERRLPNEPQALLTQAEQWLSTPPNQPGQPDQPGQPGQPD
ncbi:MAG TPA: hypothetical protein PLP25_10225 [Candidatus Limiplasma sp.]|nr:hypothetical protein [Candidatus Limiplasma sp.]HPS82217.1 hypothetical protein [Candidatus Limiplasma sp.]